MIYEGLRSANKEHLGGNFLEGDPNTYSPEVWSYLIGRFCISSILDVGSGVGHSAEYFHRKGIKTVAFDGLSENIEYSLYPTVQWDLQQGAFKTKVDLVHCMEVVEHIDEKYVQNIIDTFKSGRYICMTHALPYQDGYNHVNCQPSEYWINLMQQNNCYLMVQDTENIRKIATEKDNCQYLSQSGLLFCNRDYK